MTTPRTLHLPHLNPDDIPTPADLARANAEPPIPQAHRNGHPAVARYVSLPESLVHLGFDGETTLCGQPWEMWVARSRWPTCPECLERVA